MSPQDVINHGAFVSMSNVPPAQRIYPSCPHSVEALFIIVHVDNNALIYNCDKLVEQFQASIALTLRMLVFNCIVMGILNGFYLLDVILL